MGLTATYWILCNLCGDDAGSGQISPEDAWDYAERGDWYVHRGYGAAVCNECRDANPEIIHVHPRNHVCVLCLSGEHLEVVV